MKKASFFATIVLFMVVVGYLSPKEAKAIIIIGGKQESPVIGPFSLVAGDQAAEVRLMKAAARMGQGTADQPGERPCNVQVMFFDDMGMQVGLTARLELDDNLIIAVSFDPSMIETSRDFEDGMRYHFVAQVVFVGDPKACMGVYITAAVYDMGTMSDIVPIKIFYGDLVPAV